MNYQGRTIKFASNFVNDILNKTKTITYRLGEEYDFLQVGDNINIEDSDNGNIFAEIEILNKSHTTFGELQKERQERFKKYYHRKNISDNEKVLEVEFKVI